MFTLYFFFVKKYKFLPSLMPTIIIMSEKLVETYDTGVFFEFFQHIQSKNDKHPEEE
jgi:hypothetical protein